MTEQQIHRAVQYVTARTSYGREIVAAILKTGLEELAAVATTSTQSFERGALLEYSAAGRWPEHNSRNLWSARFWNARGVGRMNFTELSLKKTRTY